MRRSSSPPPSPGSPWVADLTRWALADAAGPPPEPPRSEPPSRPVDLDPSVALRAIVRHRVVGVLAPHVDALDLPDDVRERLRQRHRTEVATSLRVVATSREVAATLADAGLRCLLVKGAALAITQGRAPTARGAGDVDVWVAPDEAHAAVSALEVAGWHLRPKETATLFPSPHWKNRLYGWITPEVVIARENRADVDLHWRLLRSNAALPISFDDAWDRSIDLPELGDTARTTGPVDTLRHVAAHATKDGWPTLRHVVDLVCSSRVLDGPTRAGVAADDRIVRLGLAIGARLDSALLDGVPLDRRTRRLADTAWAECMSGRLELGHRRRTGGSDGVRLNLAMLGWQVRSAPHLAAAFHPVAETVIPSRALFDDAPTPVALVRDLRRRLGCR